MNIEAIWVIAAALVNFAIGGVWYAVFGEQWLSGWKLKRTDIDSKDPKPYLLALIGSFWTAYGLFLICKHIQPKNITEELTIAFGCWLFILVGTGAKHYAFARVNGKAFAVDYGADLVGITVMTMMVW